MTDTLPWPSGYPPRIDLGAPDVALVEVPGQPNGVWWLHVCPVKYPDRPTWAATALPLHTSSGEPAFLTINGSVLCEDCGCHGFVTAGKWVPA